MASYLSPSNLSPPLPTYPTHLPVSLPQVPNSVHKHPSVFPETRQATPLTLAVLQGHVPVVQVVTPSLSLSLSPVILSSWPVAVLQLMVGSFVVIFVIKAFYSPGGGDDDDNGSPLWVLSCLSLLLIFRLYQDA